MTVVFQGDNGEPEGQRHTVTGFWGGGDTWRVRFTPTFQGAEKCYPDTR